MPPLPSLSVLLAAYACLLARCAFAPDFPADSALVTPTLHAVDARGQDVPLDRLPRRPRLSVGLQVQPSALNNGPWLFTGVSDHALLDDLSKLPLSAAQLSRSVAVRHRWAGPQLEIEPMIELSPGASYTLALPRKAAMNLPQPFTAELRVDDSSLGGAAVRATFPPAQASAVPTDLALALISLDGVVQGSEHGAWLEDESSLAHPAQAEEVSCADYDSAAVSCIRLALQAPLAAASRYVLRTGRALTDAHGALVTELQAAFTTHAGTQAEVPTWQPGSCALDEQTLPFGCVLLADERVELQLFQNPALRVTAQLADQRIAVLSAGLSATLRFAELRPDQAYTLDLETFDASLHAERTTWPLRTAPVLPTLAISELNADPRGHEPEQEYLELWNFGGETQSLAGLRVSDDPQEPGTVLPEQVSLAPGARALVVSDGFDPNDTRDQSPAPGSLLVRVGKSVTRGGLANSGERLYLRTAAGYRVSSAPGLPAPRQGQCLVYTAEDPRTAEPNDWVLSDCSPGR
jgi:hypothetical protein